EELPAATADARDEPGLGKRARIHRAVGREPAELAHVHDGVLGLAAVGQEAARRQAPVERHLTALEPDGRAAARARLLALLALRGRLAVAGTDTAPDALAPLDRAGCGTKILKPHGTPAPRAARGGSSSESSAY